ncbi:MAG: hypothetical protein WC622_16255 [Pedobacter sp.]|jgi:hypothetical protein|uniref:hypothetical protein n=1 Tax=Pedobacter sp. TaxID=1411316 RepID=UPI0035648D5F
MKKLLFLLLITPIIGFAQLRSGRYFIKLMHNGKNIQYNPSLTLMLANGCADFNCPSQFFDLTMVAGSPKIYTIKNTQSGKFLTFSEDEYGNVIPGLTLQTAKTSSLNRRFQQFLINSDKDGIYSIHPRRTTGIMELFIATELRDINSGGTIIGLEYKTPDRNPANYNVFTNVIWNFIPIPIGTISRTTTSTPVVADRSQSSSSVVVTPPNNNKLDIDIRTGGDNLEQRDHQENPEIIIEINGQQSIVASNINSGQTWVNNSLHRISIPMPAAVTVEDLKSITIKRKIKRWNNDAMISSDNWTVSNVTVVANLGNKRTTLANYTSARPHTKVFRFKAIPSRDENETGDKNSVYGWGTEVNLALSQVPTVAPPPARATTVVNPIIKIETLTGGDDLRGGNDNLNVLIRLKIRPVRNISLNNINNRQSWGNFTEHTVTRPISGLPFTFDDIEDVVLRHTGGGGTGADNWYLDKLKITLTMAGETRVLVDQVSNPVHYFKGDSRSKTFQIIR